MRYIIDPFPWLLMTIYKLDQEHQISALKGGLTTTVSERDTDAVTTDGEFTRMSDTGLISNDADESQPEGRKRDLTKTEKVQDTAKTDKVQKQPKTAAPNKKAAQKAAKDAKTIENLKGAVKQSKDEMKRLQEENKKLKEVAATAEMAELEPEPEPTAEMPTTQP